MNHKTDFMLDIGVQMYAESPIHFGSDKDTGNVMLFNSKPVALRKPIIIKSQFPTAEARSRAFEIFAFLVYRSVPRDLKTKDNGYYYEKLFQNMTVALSGSTSVEDFASKLFESCQIQKLYPSVRQTVMRILRKFSLAEIRHLIQKNGRLFQITLQDLVQEQSAKWGEINEAFTHIEELKETFDDPNAQADYEAEARKVEMNKLKPENIFEKDLASFDEPADNPPTIKIIEQNVPFISGNAVKNRLRYFITEFFMQYLTHEEGGMHFSFDPKKARRAMDVDMMHLLFSGGNLGTDGDSSMADLESFLHVSPVSMSGFAKGSGTVESIVRTNFVNLQCEENGNGELSCLDYLDTMFLTRHDTAKRQNQRHLTGQKSGKSAQQMISYMEVLKSGTPMETSFQIKPADKVVVSMLLLGLHLMSKHVRLGGKGNVGLGKVEWQFVAPSGFEFEGITVKAGETFVMQDAFFKPFLDYVDSIRPRALHVLTVMQQPEELKAIANDADLRLANIRIDRLKKRLIALGGKKIVADLSKQFKNDYQKLESELEKHIETHFAHA